MTRYSLAQRPHLCRSQTNSAKLAEQKEGPPKRASSIDALMEHERTYAEHSLQRIPLRAP
jgi:hypothetical protein